MYIMRRMKNMTKKAELKKTNSYKKMGLVNAISGNMRRKRPALMGWS